MNITITSFKGGVGKSMLAHQLITSFGYKGVEIDPYGSLAQRLPLDVISIPIATATLAPCENTIFDFGGFDDVKLEQAVLMSDLVIVPFIPTLEVIQSTLDTLIKLQKYNKPILLVANMVHKEEDVAPSLSAFYEYLGFEMECFIIKTSIGLQSAINENKSIVAMSKSGGIMGFTYKKYADVMQELHKTILGYAQQ
jgi:cellulose biosynthesis protein BcsQ